MVSRDAGPGLLVVDDDLAVRELVSEILEETGFQAVAASDGDEVLPLAASTAPCPSFWMC